MDFDTNFLGYVKIIEKKQWKSPLQMIKFGWIALMYINGNRLENLVQILYSKALSTFMPSSILLCQQVLCNLFYDTYWW